MRNSKITRSIKTEEAMDGGAHGVQNARMSAEDRRRQILSVAVNLFSQRGFRGTTTKEIATAAGVSEAIIFRHFATKEDLYTAILDDCACSGGVDHFAAMIDVIQSCNDRTIFQSLGKKILDFHDENPEFQRLLLLSALEGHQLAQMFWDQMVTRTYEMLGGYIRQRQDAGAFRRMDPMIVVRAFLGMLIHHSINNNLWDRSRRIVDMSNESAASQFTEILLNGVLSDENRKGSSEKELQTSTAPADVSSREES